MANIFCSKCGAPLIEGAGFCSKCGAKVTHSRLPAPEPQPEAAEAVNAAEAKPDKTSSAAPAEKIQKAKRTAEIIGNMTSAPAQSGEFVLYDRSQLPLASNIIPAPFRAAFGGIKRTLASMKQLAKKPSAAIPALLMTVLWIVLMIWNQSGRANSLSGILSFLTFAEGGSVGSFSNKIGGIFGKGLIITALMNIFSGSLRRLPASFRKLSARDMNYGLVLAGAGAASAAYHIFAGYAGTYGAMVALSGAAVSLNALGGGTGYLHTLVSSLTARKVNGVRRINSSGLNSALTGLTIGFLVSAALSPFYYTIWLPLAAVFAGLVLCAVLPSKGGAAV